MEFIPNLFIVGAAKCGTTSLHRYLNQIPEISMSAEKEPFFFECEYDKGIQFYREKYFSNWNGEKIIGEARHRNLYLPYVAQRIYDTNPDAKIIILIRDPVNRAYSHWWHWYYRGFEKDGFEEAMRKNIKRLEESDININQQEDNYCKFLKEHGGSSVTSYIDSGFYYEQIKKYYDIFPPEQIKVILNKDLRSNRKKVLIELLEFLEINPDTVQYVEFNKMHNQQIKKRKFPKWVYKILQPTGLLKLQFFQKMGKKIRNGMYKDYQVDPAFLKELQFYYATHNQKLSYLIKRDLNHWNEKIKLSKEGS